MSIRLIDNSLPGERVVGLSPDNAAAAASVWLRRPNLFPGRALTAGALAQSQQWQAGHIAERGQDWIAGVVDGLQVEAELLSGSGFAAVRLNVTKGRGLALSGEDVVLNRDLNCLLADVPVVAPAGFFKDGSGVGPLAEDEVAGQLRARKIGDSLRNLGEAVLPQVPSIGVLVLQPVEVENAIFDPMDPCDRCAWPDASVTDGAIREPVSFEDWRIGDAVRLLWYVWPEEWRALPTALPPAQWRNALAWTIFNAEARLGYGETLPWEPYGVAIALVGLDDGRQPAWLDRASVVRRGGMARSARLQCSGKALAANSRLPSLWQAQIEQLAEQLATDGGAPPMATELAGAFGSFLPPLGLLPSNCYQAETRQSGFFPPNFSLDAVPVPVDQLDVAIRQAAALAPLDVHAEESVRLLIPVPLSSWEPRLLATEVIDPEFQATIDSFLLERARALGARQGLRNEVATLTRAITGLPQTVPGYDDDTGEAETLSPWGPPPAGGGHRSRALPGYHAFGFDSATNGFAISSNDSLYTWVYLDPDNPPSSLVLAWHPAGGGATAIVYWGADATSAPNFPAHDSATPIPRIGDLPPAGRWIKLALSVTSSGIALADNAAALDGMSFGMVDGRATFAMTGVTRPRIRPPIFNFPVARSSVSVLAESAANASLLPQINLPIFRPFAFDVPWFSNVLPAGARISAQTQSDDPWEPLSDNDLWAPFDPAGGVVPSLPDGVPPGDGGHTEPASAGTHQHYFQSATVAMVIDAGDTHLYVWAYIDANDPPQELMLQWNVDGSWEHRAFWGRDLIGWGISATASRRKIGALPRPGAWTQLRVPIADIGLATGTQVTGMAFTLYNGCAAFADAGRIGSDGKEKMWFGQRADALGGQLFGTWQFLGPAALYAPTSGARVGQVQVLQELMADPILGVLSDEERAQLPQRGLAAFVDYLRARIDRADDLIDYGFVKMQTDIYRLRQLMIGPDANRLAVSPALASIAKAETAVATQAQLADYVTKLKNTAGVAP